ncbi:MAG TPA: response regulator [Rhodanobacteraceae bacterium]|nr:response regulator [Rhodanobacteraceae bacterium]
MSKEPCKVLVVDEDRNHTDTTVMLLQVWGHEAQPAYSAEDAIAKAQAFDADVILVDLGRQPVNGLDLASELHRCCPDAKLVAIAGFTADDIVRRTREAGFERVLFKPAPAKRLQEAVENECALRRPG